MKVLFLFQSYSPYHVAKCSAVASHTMFKWVFVSVAASEAKYPWKKNGAGYLDVHYLSDSEYDDSSVWNHLHKIRRMLKAERPRVILVPGSSELPILAAAAWAQLHRVKVVLMFDSTYVDRPRSAVKERLKGLLMRFLYDGVLVAGSRSERYVRSLGLGDRPIAAPVDVVDNEYFQSGSEHIAQDRRRGFLFVGRLSDEKNVLSLISAYHRYSSSREDPHPLVIAGDGPLRSEVEDRVVKLELGDLVSLEGWVSPDGLRSLYHRSYALVLPSLSEPWGLVVNEAMACGLPVLVSERCGSSVDLVNGRGTGLVFEPSVPGIQNALEEIHHLGLDQWIEMSEKSRMVIDEYSTVVFADRVVSIIERLENV